MANFDFQLTSNRELVEKATTQQIAIALEAVGLLCEGYAKMKCPVDTGNLRNSITHTVGVEEQAAYIGTNVEYAAYVEMGTSKMKAQPYLKPAVVEHTDKYKQIVEQYLKNG